MPFCIIAAPGAELRAGDLRRGMFLDNLVVASVIACVRGLLSVLGWVVVGHRWACPSGSMFGNQRAKASSPFPSILLAASGGQQNRGKQRWGWTHILVYKHRSTGASPVVTKSKSPGCIRKQGDVSRTSDLSRFVRRACGKQWVESRSLKAVSERGKWINDERPKSCSDNDLWLVPAPGVNQKWSRESDLRRRESTEHVYT